MCCSLYSVVLSKVQCSLQSVVCSLQCGAVTSSLEEWPALVACSKSLLTAATELQPSFHIRSVVSHMAVIRSSRLKDLLVPPLNQIGSMFFPVGRHPVRFKNFFSTFIGNRCEEHTLLMSKTVKYLGWWRHTSSENHKLTGKVRVLGVVLMLCLNYPHCFRFFLAKRGWPAML